MSGVRRQRPAAGVYSADGDHREEESNRVRHRVVLRAQEGEGGKYEEAVRDRQLSAELP